MINHSGLTAIYAHKRRYTHSNVTMRDSELNLLSISICLNDGAVVFKIIALFKRLWRNALKQMLHNETFCGLAAPNTLNCVNI